MHFDQCFRLVVHGLQKKIENFEKVEKSEFFPCVVHGLLKILRRRPDNVAHALLKEHSGSSACAK